MKTLDHKAAFPKGRWTPQPAITFEVTSLPDLEQRLIAQKAAFERAMAEFDTNAANIACGRMDYLQRQIELHALLKVKVAA